jgi:hypothetical protein
MLITILTILLVLFGIAGAYFAWRTYRVTRNKRQLLYSMSPLASLLGAAPRSAAVRQNLEVLYDGKPIPRPGVIWLRLRAKGNKDITTNDFDQQRPLVFDFQIPIVDILSVESIPDPASPPVVRYEDTRIIIGPDLVRSGSVLSIAMLIDGKEAKLQSPDTKLIDVQVQRESYSYPQANVKAASRIALGFRPPS